MSSLRSLRKFLMRVMKHSNEWMHRLLKLNIDFKEKNNIDGTEFISFYMNVVVNVLADHSFSEPEILEILHEIFENYKIAKKYKEGLEK